MRKVSTTKVKNVAEVSMYTALGKPLPAGHVFSSFVKKSEVEETLERIKVQPGVEGYVICDMEGQVSLSGCSRGGAPQKD